MTEHLLVGVLGHCNAGKSSTWEHLFDQKNLKTSSYGNERRLYLSKDKREWVSVFLINGSPAEREKDIYDILNPKGIVNFKNSRIVLCSMGYPNDVVINDNAKTTLQYFVELKYHLFIHWLNPGYEDFEAYNDESQCIPYILKQPNSHLNIRNGKEPFDSRVNEIRDFIYDWSNKRGLLSRA